ncbi:protein of unknown function [Petrocella atlantisensis]|uniref:Uncharacterized protein n=1 Tax=Petrocella atlantisensis TaxID=2173034 RepID=A0A3P7S098_9FIRM|nr:protein of unknown function [Petrocella atlantisensis]
MIAIGVDKTSFYDIIDQGYGQFFVTRKETPHEIRNRWVAQCR